MTILLKCPPATRPTLSTVVVFTLSMAILSFEAQVTGDTTKSIIPAASPNFEAAFQGKCGNNSGDIGLANNRQQRHSSGNPCEHICLDLHDGTYECACFYGFLLAVDGYSCSPTATAASPVGTGSEASKATIEATAATMTTTTTTTTATISTSRPPPVEPRPQVIFEPRDRKLEDLGMEVESISRRGNFAPGAKQIGVATKLQVNVARALEAETSEREPSNQRKVNRERKWNQTNKWPRYLLIGNGGGAASDLEDKFMGQSEQQIRNGSAIETVIGDPIELLNSSPEMGEEIKVTNRVDRRASDNNYDDDDDDEEQSEVKNRREYVGKMSSSSRGGEKEGDDRRLAVRSLMESNDRLVSQLAKSVWLAEEQLASHSATTTSTNQAVGRQRGRLHHHHHQHRHQTEREPRHRNGLGGDRRRHRRRRHQFAGTTAKSQASRNDRTEENETGIQKQAGNRMSDGKFDEDEDHGDDERGSDSRKSNLIDSDAAEQLSRHRDYPVGETNDRDQLARLVQKTIVDSSSSSMPLAVDCVSDLAAAAASGCRNRQAEVPSARSTWRQRLAGGPTNEPSSFGRQLDIGNGKDRSLLLSSSVVRDFRSEIEGRDRKSFSGSLASNDENDDGNNRDGDDDDDDDDDENDEDISNDLAHDLAHKLGDFSADKSRRRGLGFSQSGSNSNSHRDNREEEEFFLDCVTEGKVGNDDYENEMSSDRRRQFGSAVASVAGPAGEGQTRCESGGKCVELNEFGKSRCVCPIGRGGRLCEKQIQRLVPRFSGRSYLALPLQPATSGTTPRTTMESLGATQLLGRQRASKSRDFELSGQQLTSLKLVFKPEMLNRVELRYLSNSGGSIWHENYPPGRADSKRSSSGGQRDLRWQHQMSSSSSSSSSCCGGNNGRRGEVTRVIGSQDAIVGEWNELVISDALSDSVSATESLAAAQWPAMGTTRNSPSPSSRQQQPAESRGTKPESPRAAPFPLGFGGHSNRKVAEDSEAVAVAAADDDMDNRIERVDATDAMDELEYEDQRQKHNGLGGDGGLDMQEQNMNRILLVTPDKIPLVATDGAGLLRKLGVQTSTTTSGEYPPATADYLPQSPPQPPELFVGGLPEPVVSLASDHNHHNHHHRHLRYYQHNHQVSVANHGTSKGNSSRGGNNISAEGNDSIGNGWLTSDARGFSGCIRSLEINGRPYDFRSDLNGDALDGFDILECRT